MQVDDATSEVGVGFLNYFDLEPQMFAWRDAIPHTIESRRSLLSDVLFFDTLLMSGGVRDPPSLYPPIDVASLSNLLHTIENTNYDRLKKDSLVYFLLKWHQDGREARFADERCISPQFCALCDAYWHLDTGWNVERAVSILSDARLNRDFASKIIEVISLSENPTPLIVKYVRTCKPLLIQPDDIDIYALSLAETAFLEAWQYQRSFSENDETRPRVLRKLVNWTLSPKPRPVPLKILVAYPFSAYEQSFIHDYAMNPPAEIPASSIPVIHDLVCTRLIHSGQFAAAVKLDRQFVSPGPHADQRQKERRQVMDEVLAVMPAIEKQLLEAELGQSSQRRESTSLSSSMSGSGLSHSWTNVGNASINDLSMSWEQVPVPAPRPASYNPLKTPAPKRAKAPLFGGVVPSRPVSEASGSTSRNPFPPVATNQPPPQPLAISVSTVNSSIPAPSLVDSTHLTSTNGFRVSQKPAPEPASFQVKASANQRPNAFYNPQQPSDGDAVDKGAITRYSRTPSPPIQRSFDDSARDIQMMLDDEGDRTAEEEPTQATDLMRPEVEETSAPFSFSVFGTSSTNGFSNTSRSEGPSMVQSQTTSSRLPPGAFAPESDEEPEEEPEPEVPLENDNVFSISTGRQRQSQRSVSPPPRRKSTTHTQTSASKKVAPELEKTIPGSLFYGETEGEDEDDVAPLPPTTPARRTQRKTRTPVNTQKQGLAQEEKVVRRSSRLSTASSRGSPSPEPLSPQKAKTRRSTRVSTASATGTRTSTRKKRS